MKRLKCTPMRRSRCCLFLAVTTAITIETLCHAADVPSDWATPPRSRLGWPWPDIAADAPLSFSEIFERLRSNEGTAHSAERQLPPIWEGQMRALLPGGAGWIGVRKNGELAMWRVADSATVALNYEALRGFRGGPFDTYRFGVVIHGSRLCAAVLERKAVQPGQPVVAGGSTLKMVNLTDGTIMAEREVESEARLVASPSGQRLILILPVAPMERRLMTETSGAPPLDDQARRVAASAVRLIGADAVDREQPLTAHIGVGCQDAGFSPHETLIWTRDPQECIRIFRGSDGRRIGPVFRSSRGTAVTVTDDAKLLMGLFGELRVYDVASGQLLAKQSEAHARPIAAVVVRPNGQSVATFGRDGTVRAWNLANLDLAGEWDAPEADDGGGCIGFIDNETIVVSAREFASNQPKPTCVLSWRDRIQLRRWNTAASGAIFRLVAVSPRGEYVVVADSAQNIGFYDNVHGPLLAFRRSPIPEVFSLYAPQDKPLAVAGPYEGRSAYVARNDVLITGDLPQLPAAPLKRWSSVSADTPNGRFTSSDYLDWFGTFAGQGVRAGQAGFPRPMGQPQGWVAIPGTDVLAAIGWDVILLYSPKTQHVVHCYRLYSRAVHAAFDPMSRTLIVIHGDGVLRHWPIPPGVWSSNHN